MRKLVMDEEDIGKNQLETLRSCRDPDF